MVAEVAPDSGSLRPQDWKSCTSEEALERAIEAAKQRMCAAPERPEKMRHWREMCRLIDLRTPSRRRFMERMAGLA
jgi:hypothetical protein